MIPRVSPPIIEVRTKLVRIRNVHSLKQTFGLIDPLWREEAKRCVVFVPIVDLFNVFIFKPNIRKVSR